jgi:hypothetical protein
MAIIIARRKFIAALGSTAAAWPLAAVAQQPAVPVIGFLKNTTAGASTLQVAAFRQGLNEMGFEEGRVTWPSNITMRTTTTIDCRNWPPIWCGAQ